MDSLWYVRAVGVFVRLVPLENVSDHYLMDVELDAGRCNCGIVRMEPQDRPWVQRSVNGLDVVVGPVGYHKWVGTVVLVMVQAVDVCMQSAQYSMYLYRS